MKKTVTHINRILNTHELQTAEDLSALVSSTIAQRENNIRLTCRDKVGNEYILKYSIMHLNSQVQHQGIRAKLNLHNEILFYKTTDAIPKKDIIIPKLFAYSRETIPWIILEKLQPVDVHLFTSDLDFTQKSYPAFFATSIIKGVYEMQHLPIDTSVFIIQGVDRTKEWLAQLNHVYTTSLKKRKKIVERLFERHAELFENNSKYLSHNDIVPDTIGYHKKTRKLVLLDFEKVQITHHAFDFASMCSNPLTPKWRNVFEKELFTYYPSKDFKTLFYLACLLRTMAKIDTFISGRLDHIFEGIIGEKQFHILRPQFIQLWGKQAEEYLLLLEAK